MSDPQDQAEGLDDDAIGTADPILSEDIDVDYPPDRPHGVQFADADVTDESFAEREEQLEPEVWERPIRGGPVPDDEVSSSDAQEPNEPS